MSSRATIAEPAPGLRNPEFHLRDPRERTVMVHAILMNVAIVACIAAVLVLAPDWLEGRPRVANLVKRLRTAIPLFFLLLAALPLLRRARAAYIAENAVRLGPGQMPELHGVLESHCRRLGVEVPELYLSAAADVRSSSALSLHGGRRIIVLGPDLFAGLSGDLTQRLDAFSFVLGHELGRLELGHAGYAQEVLFGYLKRVPLLRAPLIFVQARSRDRYGAFLAPDGVRGLLLQVVGGAALRAVDVTVFLDNVMSGHHSTWARLGALGHLGPPLERRVRALYREGFFDLERDRARFAAAKA